MGWTQIPGWSLLSGILSKALRIITVTRKKETKCPMVTRWPVETFIHLVLLVLVDIWLRYISVFALYAFLLYLMAWIK